MPVSSNNKYKHVLVNVINIKDIAYISASIYLLIHSLPFILSRVAVGARVYPSYHRVTLDRLPVCCRANPCKHRENIQTPHRNALGRLWPRDLLVVKQQC